MKNAFLKILSIFVVGCLFFSCDPSAGNNTNDDEQQQGTPGKNIKKNIDVKFDFSGAQALAKLEAKKDGSRAVINADDLGDLVKILANGSMENAITVGENCSLSDIVAIYKSPLEDSKDIFIVFNSESVLGYEQIIERNEWGTSEYSQEIRVGQLICLHEDGSITDILKKDDVSNSWNSHMSLRTESVTFDANGYLYFISSDNGDMIYQFDPKTNELVNMVAAVENTSYEKMQIDDEGQWIFVSGYRYTGSSSYFLRAIPISNPNGFVNIYYSSNSDGQISSNHWVYDAKNEIIYYITKNGNNSGLFKASKNKGFKDREYINYSVGSNFSDFLLEYYSVDEGIYSWTDSMKNENGEFCPQNVLSHIYAYFLYSDDQTGELIDMRKYVDIKFDKYASCEGVLHDVYELTKGKKNEDVFRALDTFEGLKTLYNLYNENTGYFDWDMDKQGYSHNFFADIMYEKDTDTLLVNSDDILFEYECMAEKRTVKGKDLFEPYKYSNGSFSNSYISTFLIYVVSGNPNVQMHYRFSSEFYDSFGNLDKKMVLDHLLNYCNITGSIDFSLKYFKDDEKYEDLYSELMNEDAIEWLSKDKNRMSLLKEYFDYYLSESCSPTLGNYDVELIMMDKSSCYFRLMDFISKTCYLSGTDKRAVTWNCNDPFNITYEISSWDNKGKLFINDNGLFYEYTNLADSNYSWSDNQKYYYIVQISDSEGRIIEMVNKLPLPDGYLIKSEKTSKYLILQYSLTDSNGAELGYHHIYSVEMANGLVTNCFDNVPNRNNLEVVSFNSAGDLLYYSAVRGTLVENGIVNLLTNEYNPLSVQRKMVAVYTFN